MTRTNHTPHSTPQFPIACLDWLGDDLLALGGGGGASRSGLANKVRVVRVSKDGTKMEDVREHVFEKGEDAPTSMAVDRVGKRLVVGVNETESNIKAGRNRHCRAFSYADEQLKPVSAAQTISAEWVDLDYPYQKLTALNPTASLLALGSTDDRVAVLTWPELGVVSADVRAQERDKEGEGKGDELVDLDWSHDGSWLAITTTSCISLYSVSPPASSTLGETRPTLRFRQPIFPPSLDILPAQFRACRFSPYVAPPTPPNASAGVTQPAVPLRLYAILNATKPKVVRRGKGGQGAATRKAWAVTFGVVAGASQKAPVVDEKGKGKEKEQGSEDELGKWDVVSRREIGGKPVTSFDVSPDGKLLAYALSDNSIGVLEAKTLAPMLRILHAHSFAITGLKFNPTGSLLASAGADNMVRLIVVPSSFGGVSMPLLAFLIALILLAVAVLLQRRALGL